MSYIHDKLVVAVDGSVRKLPTGTHFPLPGAGERGHLAAVDIVACRRAEAAESSEEGALKNPVDLARSNGEMEQLGDNNSVDVIRLWPHTCGTSDGVRVAWKADLTIKQNKVVVELESAMLKIYLYYNGWNHEK